MARKEKRRGCIDDNREVGAGAPQYRRVSKVAKGVLGARVALDSFTAHHKTAVAPELASVALSGRRARAAYKILPAACSAELPLVCL